MLPVQDPSFSCKSRDLNGDSSLGPLGLVEPSDLVLAFIPLRCYPRRRRTPAGRFPMTDPAFAAAPKKRGPNTPEGKARSSMNARRHGMRARTFGILPGEDQAEWAEHLADLQAGYGPVDDTERKLVEAIAAAMWNEIRADRMLTEVLAAIPPLG